MKHCFIGTFMAFTQMWTSRNVTRPYFECLRCWSRSRKKSLCNSIRW